VAFAKLLRPLVVLCRSLPIFDQLCASSFYFVHGCLFCDSDIVKFIDGRDDGITWETGKLADLKFTDDIAFISDPTALQNMTTELQGNAAKLDYGSVQKKPSKGSWKHTRSPL